MRSSPTSCPSVPGRFIYPRPRKRTRRGHTNGAPSDTPLPEKEKMQKEKKKRMPTKKVVLPRFERNALMGHKKCRKRCTEEKIQCFLIIYSHLKKKKKSYGFCRSQRSFFVFLPGSWRRLKWQAFFELIFKKFQLLSMFLEILQRYGGAARWYLPFREKFFLKREPQPSRHYILFFLKTSERCVFWRGVKNLFLKHAFWNKCLKMITEFKCFNRIISTIVLSTSVAVRHVIPEQPQQPP